jgi:hypothetical protein
MHPSQYLAFFRDALAGTQHPKGLGVKMSQLLAGP